MQRSKSRESKFLAVLVLGTILAACGGGSGSDGSGTTPANPPSGIGPAGGVVTGPYGATLTVPSGALTNTVDLAVARDAAGAPDLLASGVDTAGAPYALTPHGTAFAAPSTVRIPFDAARIPTDADPVLYKAEPGGAFAPIATTIDNDMLVADVSGLSWVIPAYASTRPRVVYALKSGSSGFQVSSYKITRTSGALAAATSSVPTGDKPISVTVHPSRRFLYVTNGGGNTVSGIAPNSIASYRLDAVTGEISGPTGSQPINGHPVAAVVHPTGKFIYVVNEVRFGSPLGNVSVLSVDATAGTLSAPATTADSAGAPATAIAFSPSGEFAYVTYLHAVSTPVGNTYWDTVKTFAVDPTSGGLTGPIGSAPTGDNPWSIVVTPGGHFVYVVSLSTQGSVGNLSTYSISQSGALTLLSSTTVSSQPSSLAMDPMGRFLYLAKQQPDGNQNLIAYRINASSGALSPASGMLLGGGSEVGPVAVVAEPQGQFVYAIDASNSALVAYTVNTPSGALSVTGAPVTGVYAGGASGGVGDPFSFAASGTSPVWQDGCTFVYLYYVGYHPPLYGGCPLVSTPTGGSSGGGGGGGGSDPPPPPAAQHNLTVTIGTWGGSVVSTPAGIDYSLDDLARNVPDASFSTGTTVQLCETPPSGTGRAYDVLWTGTGGCGGTATCTSVRMTADESCRVELIPK